LRENSLRQSRKLKEDRCLDLHKKVTCKQHDVAAFPGRICPVITMAEQGVL